MSKAWTKTDKKRYSRVKLGELKGVKNKDYPKNNVANGVDKSLRWEDYEGVGFFDDRRILS